MARDTVAMHSIDQGLRAGAAQLPNCQSPLLDARVLLKFATGLEDAGLIAMSNDFLTQGQAQTYFDLIARRASGEPAAYITGVKEFWSLLFRVTPDTLIPRGDSECLIETALARRSRDRGLSILDLGSGSGCLLCALLHEYPEASGIGVDRSAAAVAIARENARNAGVHERAGFFAGDWANAINTQFDVIIANPPYIPDGDKPGLPVDISGFEPPGALFAGPDGFDAYIAILSDIGRILAPHGLIVLEAGDGQALPLLDILTQTAPTAETGIINDLGGTSRGVFADLKTAAEKD